MAKKKTKLDTLTQTTGKVQEVKQSKLDQIFGFNDMARYGTISEAEYTEQLLEMNKADLQTHALKLGIGIVSDIERQRNILLEKFRGYVAQLNRPEPIKNVTKVSKAVERILAEGR